MNRFAPTILALFAVLTFHGLHVRPAVAEEMDLTLYLVGASAGTTPLIVTARGAQGAIDGVTVLAPYGPPAVGTRFNARGSVSHLRPAEVETVEGMVGGGSLSLALAGAFPEMPGSDFTVDVSARIEGGRVVGEWKGKGTTGREGGAVLGWHRRARYLEDGVPVSITLDGPRSSWDGRYDMHIHFTVQDGRATDLVVSGTPVGSAYNTRKFPRPVVPTVGSDGRTLSLITTDTYVLKELIDSKVTRNSLELRFHVKGGVEDVVVLMAEVVGGSLVGTADVGDRSLSLLGQVGVPTPSPLPEFKPGTPKDRTLRALLWAYASPEMGGVWSNDANAASVRATGSKQYDNFSENAYGGMASMATLARLARDPDLAHEARLRAMRAGWAMHARGAYHDGLALYYKSMVWLSVWGPMGYLELHELTGDPIWLERPVAYAGMLRRTQMDVGTWTYFNEEDGSIGTSNSRNDRSFDNSPLHCGDYLLFLGRLRMGGGITGFKDVEERATAWMMERFREDPAALFTDRRPGSNREGSGAVWLAQYLTQFGGEANRGAARDVVAYIEAHFMETTYGQYLDVPGFKPAVIDYYPRWTPQDRPAPASAATTGLALVYQALGRHPQARALAESVLSRQDEMGLIDHIGRMDLPPDHEKRINAGGPDQHQMSVRRAETLVNLARFHGLPAKAQ